MSLIKVWEWRDFNYWLEIIAALWFERGRSRKRYGRLRYVRTKRFEKAIDCQQGEAKRSFRGFVTVVINMIIIVLLLVLFGRVTVLYSILYCVLLLFIKVMLRCCGDCAFSASFVRESTDVSHVAGEGVELTVYKKSFVVEEIKEVELRLGSWCAICLWQKL